MTIYGDPGVGKSRLVAEFTATAEARVVRGRCLPYGDGITFWPLAEIAKAELGVLDTDDTGDGAGKVRRWRVGTGADGPRRRSPTPSASTIPASPLRELSPRAVIAEIHAAWRGFFARMAADGPVVAVIEDIHWADGAMLDLLEELPDRHPGAGAVLCARAGRS